MKNRALRRHLTERYQSRQLKLRAIFIGNNHLTNSSKGKLRKQSWRLCGRPKCCLCNSGTRNDKWASNNDKLTMNEKRCRDYLKDVVLDMIDQYYIR